MISQRLLHGFLKLREDLATLMAEILQSSRGQSTIGMPQCSQVEDPASMLSTLTWAVSNGEKKTSLWEIRSIFSHSKWFVSENDGFASENCHYKPSETSENNGIVIEHWICKLSVIKLDWLKGKSTRNHGFYHQV